MKTKIPLITIGLDLGDKKHAICALNAEGGIIDERTNHRESLRRLSHKYPERGRVIGNSDQTWKYAWFARKLVYKWLNRRSQRKSFTVTSFVAAWERWQMPEPRIAEEPLPRPC